MEFRPGDAHGVEGVDVEDVEATASVHQHLGEALLVDNGADDERVATWAGGVGRMVPLIKSDLESDHLRKEGMSDSVAHASL